MSSCGVCGYKLVYCQCLYNLFGGTNSQVHERDDRNDSEEKRKKNPKGTSPDHRVSTGILHEGSE